MSMIVVLGGSKRASVAVQLPIRCIAGGSAAVDVAKSSTSDGIRPIETTTNKQLYLVAKKDRLLIRSILVAKRVHVGVPLGICHLSAKDMDSC